MTDITPFLPADLDYQTLVDIDKQAIWHPYSSTLSAPDAYPVVSAEGVYFQLADGRKIIDGMSSWWCAMHGYNHPVLNAAMQAQIGKMSHVMFGGITHPPAVELSKLLIDITPEQLTKVFYSDSGSVAVEVAIKMALQYWNSQGKDDKHRLLTVRNGYHGDTFGAMATCDPVNGMHHLFSKVMPEHIFAEAPACAFDAEWDERYISDLANKLQQHQDEIAAVIIEPVVQGAGGMRFYSPHYLKRLRELCDEYDVLLILDEIATGFGRTGELFACQHAGIQPDIMAIGKALTGGNITLAATLCTDKVSDGICRGEAGVFMHGPTFMGNPLACATALASTRLLLSQDWQAKVKHIEAHLKEALAPLATLDHIDDVRVLGAIGVVEAKQPVDMAKIQAALVDEGIWLRPFGKLIYVMPTFMVINDEELETLTKAMVKVVSQPELFAG
ncbi:adenosylmethionine--8-amino-7-oxononanoate transaminase [Maricurvus nonylphenolicus]|uniref:adenosylmethionine--8-amino-7-oxononanoate transaminase n=1 Tax=Maricurvus nonylphenolicus TaxID=1008307 RepID=UPI0036F33122